MKRSSIKRRARLARRPFRCAACGRDSGRHEYGCPKAKPIGRGEGPKRKKRMAQRAKKRARFREERRDQEWLDWIHTQPCRLLELLGPHRHRCTGVLEADHQGGDKGMALKDHDRTTVIMCTGAHRQRTERRGFFRGWSWAQMRKWCDDNIAEMSDRFAAEKGRL